MYKRQPPACLCTCRGGRLCMLADDARVRHQRSHSGRARHSARSPCCTRLRNYCVRLSIPRLLYSSFGPRPSRSPSSDRPRAEAHSPRSMSGGIEGWPWQGGEVGVPWLRRLSVLHGLHQLVDSASSAALTHDTAATKAVLDVPTCRDPYYQSILARSSSTCRLHVDSSS